MPTFTSQQYEQYLARQANSEARHTRQTAKLESGLRDASLGTEQVQEKSRDRVLVRVESIRKRLLDEDNLCEKFHVDLCRYAGIISCDSPDKFKIEVGQRKTEKGELERTEITITRI